MLNIEFVEICRLPLEPDWLCNCETSHDFTGKEIYQVETSFSILQDPVRV